MIRIHDISLPAREDAPETLQTAVRGLLRLAPSEATPLHIVRRSIDARKKSDVRVIYTVDVTVPDEKRLLEKNRSSRITKAEVAEYEPPRPLALPGTRPIVAGFGPAGIFAALVLAGAGARPIVLERGLDVDARREKVQRFWETGQLDPQCNVQFGEGGAGTFSDGKLNTGTHDPRIPWVLQSFVGAGAPERILYDAKPHMGTDVLRNVVKNLRARILALGGEVRFGTRLTGLVTDGGRLKGVRVLSEGASETLSCENVILAIGHSARDTVETLLSEGIAMEPKPFAMGVRIEHRQREIDRAQYGSFAGLRTLGAADYKLSLHTPAGSVYTFCMCPGGYVVAASSEEGSLVTNGMSYSGRAGENANSALLVGLTPSDFPHPGVLGGMRWQRELEQRAFTLGGGDYRAPVQTVGDFLGTGPAANPVTPTLRPGVTDCDLRSLLPGRVSEALTLALPELDRKLHGFASPNAVLTAPETRSSSPVRILRGPDRQSVTCRGLYPCGEGAGYAGGIVSAAVDGIRCAEAVLS